MSTVLVVDDKELMRDSVGATLQRAGFTVATATDGEQALEEVARKRPDAVVTDLRMPRMDGVELASRVAEIDDTLPVIVMTAYGTIETAVRAIKAGAFDYITKPFEGDELIIAVKRGMEHRRLRRENAVLRLEAQAGAARGAINSGAGVGAAASGAQAGAGGAGPGAGRGLDRIVGSAPATARVKEQLPAIAASHGTVLITGESGTGKEVFARAIHELSSRAEGPFLAVNCAALSESLLESELFGHEKGAFTGADKLRKGRFELADGGTLLLDEVSEIPPQLQAKLLRVLQERAFERVGSSRTIGVDVRVIATSNRDLPAEVAKGAFRQDLYFRLNILPVRLSPLRERAQDVAELARYFVAMVCAREGRPEMPLDEGALALLRSYPWPGNVRELQNICERAVVLGAARGAVGGPGSGAGGGPGSGVGITHELIAPWLGVDVGAAPAAVGGAGVGGNGLAHGFVEVKNAAVFEESGSLLTIEELERRAIVGALRRFSGHRQRTAQALGIGVRTLGLKLKRWKQLQLVEQTL
jgi:DNA-binding NtrC family response regulator